MRIQKNKTNKYIGKLIAAIGVAVISYYAFDQFGKWLANLRVWQGMIVILIMIIIFVIALRKCKKK